MQGRPNPASKNTAGDPGSVVEFPGTPEGARPPNNLPLQLSSFIGRAREIAEVEALLADTRLLTLTGAGGSGKTRLALAVASGVVEGFRDGAWLVDLAPLSDPELVAQAVASVLGLREAPGSPLLETLLDHLEPRTMLLLLDNCEHLVDACASLAEALLRRCPSLSVLATSREALGVEGETLFVVPPLSVPDPRRPPAASDLSDYEAAGLFVERARAASPGFTLTEGNAEAVAQVCHRLDGMPLAIEFAAARARALSVEQISERLEDSFALLTGGRRTALAHHGTLRATMDWSHDLLSGEEKALLRRLSVFAGGWTLGAAESVCVGEGLEEAAVLDLLASLVEKSLVMVSEQDGEARYRLLETVRQYALERMGESGEGEAFRQKHAEHYLALAEEAARELNGPDHLRWLTRLEREHDNLRAGLRRSLEGGDEGLLGLRLTAAMWSFWYTRGHLSEGRRWLEGAISKHGPTTHRAKAQALSGLGYIALFQGDYEAAQGFLEQGLVLYRQLDEKEGIASSLVYLGFVAVLGERDLETVPSLYEEAAGLGPAVEDPRVAANLLLFSGLIAISRGEMVRADVLHEEALALFRQMGDIQGIGHCLNNLGLVGIAQGDYDRASRFLRENLIVSRRADYKLGILYPISMLGTVAARQGKLTRAARLWGSYEAMGEVFGIGTTRMGRSASNYDTLLTSVRSRLDEAAWEAAWSEGRAMSQEDAIDYALGVEEAAAPPPEEEAASSLLSGREAEVLALVAEGLTNPQIARRLYLSPRTVGQHLRSIYRKIGVSSRAAAVREASERGLI